MNRRAFLKTTGAAAALSAVPAVVRAQGKEVKLGYILPVTVRQVTEKNKTRFMLLAAVADNLTEGGLKYVFRVQPNGKAMSTLTMNNLVEMAKASNTTIKRVAMMHEDGNFGTTMGNHVEAFGAKLGYTMVQRIPSSLQSPDFTAELSKVKASKPDLLVI